MILDLDHVRLVPEFLGGTASRSSWVLALVNENYDGFEVHKLLTNELRQVLASPEVLKRFEKGMRGTPLTTALAMSQRIAELQAIVDKREATRSGVDVALGVCEDLVKERGATAETLWQMLDDIDTLGDSIKPNDLAGYHRFWERTLQIAHRRHLLLKSDGHTLTWPSSDKVPRGAQQVVPEPLVRTEADASFWKARYEDLKLGVQNRLADEHVQPAFEENAVLLARMPTQEPRQRYDDLVDCIEHLMQGYAFETKFPEHQGHAKILSATFDAAHAALRPPIPMLLHCPMCHARHIDEGEFATRCHHSHACQGYVVEDGKRRRCGHVWRPAIVPTVGVEALPGFVNEPTTDNEPVGKLGRHISSGFMGTVRRSGESTQGEPLFELASERDTRMVVRRHEFTVIDV